MTPKALEASKQGLLVKKKRRLEKCCREDGDENMKGRRRRVVERKKRNLKSGGKSEREFMAKSSSALSGGDDSCKVAECQSVVAVTFDHVEEFVKVLEEELSKEDDSGIVDSDPVDEAGGNAEEESFKAVEGKDNKERIICH